MVNVSANRSLDRVLQGLFNRYNDEKSGSPEKCTAKAKATHNSVI